jgi:hypothetical protein
MLLTRDLPDELSAALSVSGADLSRAAVEAIALEAYRERKVTASQLQRLLGFETRYELDGFLKQHQVWLDYTWQDIEQDGKRIGGLASEPCRASLFPTPRRYAI